MSHAAFVPTDRRSASNPRFEHILDELKLSDVHFETVPTFVLHFKFTDLALGPLHLGFDGQRENLRGLFECQPNKLTLLPACDVTTFRAAISAGTGCVELLVAKLYSKDGTEEKIEVIAETMRRTTQLQSIQIYFSARHARSVGHRGTKTETHRRCCGVCRPHTCGRDGDRTRS